MHHSPIMQDVDAVVERAILDQLHLLSEVEITRRSDGLLRNLPMMDGPAPTTALLLRRYRVPLHAELCDGNRPRLRADDAGEQLRELTRAVLVTIGAREGVPVEAAMLIGLLLLKRGVATFCAQPVPAAVAA
jgi:hypothetical protein